MKKYNINESDIGIDYLDVGPWRTYGIESSGSTIEELFANAYVYETDKGGGEITNYPLEEADYDVEYAAKKILGVFVEEVDDKEEEEEGLFFIPATILPQAGTGKTFTLEGDDDEEER